ncbi:unnamed protein product, partial [Urochloa humidicola]
GGACPPADPAARAATPRRRSSPARAPSRPPPLPRRPRHAAGGAPEELQHELFLQRRPELELQDEAGLLLAPCSPGWPASWCSILHRSRRAQMELGAVDLVAGMRMDKL